MAKGVNADRDVIFVDQRSTLHADPFLNCPEIDTFNVALLGLAPTAASTQAAQLAATDACHARLRASGYNLAAFDTAQNAADIADLRTALGIKEWNIYGVSYGSDLALTILRDHPAGVRSLVVDGVVPPQSVILNEFWPDAAAGYETLIKACEAQPACNAAYPNLRRELIDAVNTLDRHPLTVTVPADGRHLGARSVGRVGRQHRKRRLRRVSDGEPPGPAKLRGEGARLHAGDRPRTCAW